VVYRSLIRKSMIVSPRRRQDSLSDDGGAGETWLQQVETEDYCAVVCMQISILDRWNTVLTRHRNKERKMANGGGA